MASEGVKTPEQGEESLPSTVDTEGEQASLVPPQPPTSTDSATVPTTPTTEAPSISFASSSPSTPSQSYANLAYAPRQSPMAQARRLGTSTPTAKQASEVVDSTTKGKPLPAEPSPNVIVTPAEASSDAQAGNETTAKAEEQRRMMDEALAKCKDLGLNPHTSPGWPLLLKLAEASDGEWKELADLVSQGDATLLLPLSSKSSSATAPKGTVGPGGAVEEALPAPSLSYAHDHILIGPNARPGPSSTSSPASATTSKGLATLSGLRGVIDEDVSSTPSRTKLTIRSFVCRRDRSWVGELKNKGMRRQLFSSLPPLPKASCTDYPFPNYTLSTAAEIEVPVAPSPPPLPPRPRAGSAASLTAPGLGLGPASPQRSSTSGSTFATLFGGSARAKGRASAANDGVTESADTLADVTASTSDAQAPARSRKIHIVLIDRPLRRSRALRGMAYSIQARLRTALEREANIPSEIGEEVGTFASAFYPTMESTSSNTAGGSAAKGSRRSGGGVRELLPAIPYTAQPDHLQMSFQTLYTQVHQQLQEVHRKTSGWDDEQTVEAIIRKQAESVESLLIEEVYDRIFCPSHSSDPYSDENLASRIAALNVLGLDWDGLGISLPSQGSANGDVIRRGLDSILASCEAELRMLQTADCYTPRRKLDVLVSLHRIIVDGLAKLPAIKLKDGDEGGEKEKAEPASGWDEPTPSKPESGNTTSADLILPVLIRLLIKANPPSLNSHLLFIQRYRSEALLREGGGETAYCLINFQAAVQFIENAKPADLGLEDAGKGIGLDMASSSTFSVAATSAASASADGDAGSGSRRSAIELLKNVSSAQQQQQQEQQQQRPAAQQQSLTSGAVIGGVAGRMKGLTGVVNSSFSVLGKVIGSGASAGMEAWDRSSKNMDGIKTLDDIRSLLGRGGATGAAPAGNNAAPGLTTAVAAAAAMGRGAGGTDYGKEELSGWDAPSPAQPSTAAAPPVTMLSSSASSLSKPSLSDRFASLNRRLASPAAPEQTLPATSTPKRPPLLANGGGGAGSSGTLGGSTLGLTTRTTTAGRDPITTTVADPSAAAASSLPASLRSPYPPLPRPPTAQRPLHIVLASTGSVASIKIPLIIEALLALGHVRVQVVATKSSLHFYKEEEVRALGGGGGGDASAYTVKDLAAENLAASRGGGGGGGTNEATTAGLKRPRCHIWRDEDEWSSWDKVGDAILHIELRRWADVVLVAPCSANCLAKIAGGLCDNLLTCFLRALDPSTPTLLFPAMNTLMYLHPLTAQHLDVAQRVLGYEVHGPIEKRLACGDLGSGAMLEWTDIVEVVRQRFGLPAGGAGGLVSRAAEKAA